MKLTIHSDGFEGYAKRAVARARKLDRREPIKPEITITFENPLATAEGFFRGVAVPKAKKKITDSRFITEFTRMAAEDLAKFTPEERMARLKSAERKLSRD